MAPPQSAVLFVDDQDPEVKYLCSSTKQQVLSSYYKNTWTSVDSEDCGKGWFEYSFYGTGIQVSAAFATPANYSVKIDDAAFVSQTGNGTFASPVLKDGKHTITYAIDTPKVMPALDYLAVTAGPSTLLMNKTIAVDGNDNSVIYSGSWADSSPHPTSFDYSTTMFHGTSRWATKVGDSLTFQFEGNSVALYGIVAYNATSPKNITANYAIDGVSRTWTISNDTTAFLPMLELFRADVAPGAHTLTFNITDIQGDRAVGIDFFSYNATFNSLAPSAQSGTATSKPTWAPKVGISIGVIAGVALIGALAMIFWKRSRLQRHQGNKYTTQA